jgi:hypothetical protein
LPQVVPAVVATHERPPHVEDDRMTTNLATVRARGAKYQDIEYVARAITRKADRKDSAI